MLSIVTINKNNSLGLAKTILSLNSQSNQNFQWILVDGCSTDTSLQALNLYSGNDSCIISENDDGIYDAMNKGINFCKNPYVLFLNSGDVFFDDFAIERIATMYCDQFDIILAGFSVRGKVRLSKPNWWRFWSLPTSHQSIIYSRALISEHKFDTSYTRAADFEHYLRINKSILNIGRIDNSLIINEPYGSDNFLSSVLAEYGRALIANGYPRLWAILIMSIKKYYLKLALR